MGKILENIFGIQLAYAQSASSDKSAPNPLDFFSFILERLPLWLTAIIVFALSLIVGLAVKKMVENRLASKVEEEHQEVLIIAGRVTFVTVAIIGTTVALGIAGINITTIVAAVGFGISFGLQDTISNFVAGIALLASRPFTIGDWIKVSGRTGKVVEIRTRATYLKTFDGMRLIVPNSELYKSQVLSYTSNPMRRLKVPVYCRYGVDMKDVFTICLKEVKKNPKIFLEPKPNVVVTDLADSYIALELRFWVDSKSLWRRIQSKTFMAVQNRLEEAGLDSPYAITSLSFEQDLESAVVKTKSLDADEFTKMMNARVAEEAKLAKNREELTKKEESKPQPVVVDQTGGMFLKAAEQMPPVQQKTQPSVAPAWLQQASQQAAQPSVVTNQTPVEAPAAQVQPVEQNVPTNPTL